MRDISAHELLKTHFCVRCGADEVPAEGLTCEKCLGYLGVLKGEPAPRSIFSNTERLEPAMETDRESVSTILSEREQQRLEGSGFKCKVEGCDEPVLMHKGATAGWCTKLQANGKTHRQERMDFLRNRPSAGPEVKKRLSERSLEEIGVKPASRNKDDGVYWLSDVKLQINNALDEVEKAEEDLEDAKERLRDILKEAQRAVQ